jgi:hypothetical protein
MDDEIYDFPAEIVAEIIQHVPFRRSNWINILLTNKKYLQVGQKVFYNKLKERNDVIINASSSGNFIVK